MSREDLAILCARTIRAYAMLITHHVRVMGMRICVCLWSMHSFVSYYSTLYHAPMQECFSVKKQRFAPLHVAILCTCAIPAYVYTHRSAVRIYTWKSRCRCYIHERTIYPRDDMEEEGGKATQRDSYTT